MNSKGIAKTIQQNPIKPDFGKCFYLIKYDLIRLRIAFLYKDEARLFTLGAKILPHA